MSIEYSSSTVPDATTRTFLRQSLGNTSEYVVLPSESELVIPLRFANKPRRDEWEADVELRFDDGFGVAFHSATRDERDGLLALLDSWMLARGHQCSFEEV